MEDCASREAIRRRSVICNIKWHSATIDSSVRHGIMRETSSEFDVSNKEFTGEDRETYWKYIVDLKRLETGKKRHPRRRSKPMV
jgi:hypothetical protein